MTARPSAAGSILGCVALAILVAACSSSSTTSTTHSPAPSVHIATAPPVPSAAAGSALALQQAFVAVVNRVRPSVVLVETDSGLGSGVVFDSNGDVVTNDHVVAGAQTLRVTGDDSKKHTATLVGSFLQEDLAVIHVDGLNLPAVAFADSGKLQVGDIAIAIGNPLGLQSSVTEGIVSAVGRAVDEGNGNVLPDVIQTSAAINPGNSGGALVDLGGNLIGIPTLAAVDQQLGGAAPGIGFAIPSNAVKDVATQLVQFGHVVNSHRAYMGIKATTTFGGAVLIQSVIPGGPAASAGLRAGDVINSVNGQQVASLSDLDTILAQLHPGDHIQVAVTHQDGSSATYMVTLGELPAIS